MSNQKCKTRLQIVNVNVDDPLFFPFSIKTSKCSCSCNNVNNPWAKLCVSDVVNLVSGINETGQIGWHEMCKFKCRFNRSVCNNIQPWNDDIFRCECKELIDKDGCDKRFLWHPSNWECEYCKSCDFSAYLDFKNCKCKKRLADKLAEEIYLKKIKISKKQG